MPTQTCAFLTPAIPQGVYANLTIQLARQLDINSLRVWGAIYGLITLILWSLVFTRTLSLTYNGVIFESPCIEEINLALHVQPHLRHTQDRHEPQEAADKKAVRVEVFQHGAWPWQGCLETPTHAHATPAPLSAGSGCG